jgi:hypothetical protein
VRKTKSSALPKRRANKSKIRKFKFNTPTAGSILDLGESSMIESAIRKAQGGV